MFSRRRHVIERVVEEVVDGLVFGDRVGVLAMLNQPHSAGNGFAIAHDAALQVDHCARLYLVLGEQVNPSGLAPSWQFFYLFPERRWEAQFTTRTGDGSVSGRAELVHVVNSFPATASTEATMMAVGGSYMTNLVEQAWQDRIDRLQGLPVDFCDSSDAVAVMGLGGFGLFGSGTVRMKGRTLPTGAPVWEVTTPTDVIHTAFARS